MRSDGGFRTHGAVLGNSTTQNARAMLGCRFSSESHRATQAPAEPPVQRKRTNGRPLSHDTDIMKHETDTSPVPVFMLTIAQVAVKGVMHEHSDNGMTCSVHGSAGAQQQSDVAFATPP